MHFSVTAWQGNCASRFPAEAGWLMHNASYRKVRGIMHYFGSNVAGSLYKEVSC